MNSLKPGADRASPKALAAFSYFWPYQFAQMGRCYRSNRYSSSDGKKTRTASKRWALILCNYAKTYWGETARALTGGRGSIIKSKFAGPGNTRAIR